MSRATTPAHLGRLLGRLREVRPTPRGYVALCPCPDHNRDGDQHASLDIALGDNDAILINCPVGCQTDAVLDALRMDWADLYPADREASPHAEPMPEPQPILERADTDASHRAYGLLLQQLGLDEAHREDLRRRGLPDSEIDRRGYRSLRNLDRGKAAQAVHEQLGDPVLGVPGFVQGAYGVTLNGESTGLLVPVRDLHGRIQAIKIRREQEPKYVYLTGGVKGTSPGSPVHVPLGVGPSPLLRVTEGELKADVCVAIDATPTIGVPGVAQWRIAMPLLKELGTNTVVIAFDAPDVRGKPPVFEQAELFYRCLLEEGYEALVEDWE